MSKAEDPFTVELTPDLILRAYQAGIFPMAEDAGSQSVFWVSPPERGVFPLDGLHVSKSLKKAIRQSNFEIRVDTDFQGVIEGCATAGTDRESTWINPAIRAVYSELFLQGHCHTVEVWDGEALVGGLYGLSIGGAFFGESMFHRTTNASKMAMVHLVARLNAGGYHLLDTQFLTDHLESLGGIEIPSTRYEALLADALEFEGDFYALDQTNKDLA